MGPNRTPDDYRVPRPNSLPQVHSSTWEAMDADTWRSTDECITDLNDNRWDCGVRVRTSHTT
jgi:hypothetical protein